MESANQHIGSSSSSSSSSSSPSCFGTGTTAHAWTTAPTSILNITGPIRGSLTAGETLFDSREPRLPENSPFLSSQYSSMPPGLTFHWGNPTYTLNNQCTQDLQLSRIKEELSDHYYRKYNEMLSSSSSSSSMDESSGLIIRDAEERNLQSDDDLATKLLLKSFSSGNLLDKIQLLPAELYPSNGVVANCGRLGLSQIFPNINVSNLNQTGSIQSLNPNCLDMNLEALDLLASSRFNGNIGPSSQNQIGMFRDGFMNYGFDHMLESQQMPLYSSNKISSSASSNGVLSDAKRSSSSKIELNAPLQSAPKKSRLEARTSCPPFKVRKEKLGDRVAALQQLVAPFGKTDTASVLMEAIGYIKFLQNQVETLSVPYMKAASRNKSTRSSVFKAGGEVERFGSEDNQAMRRDLKSRGLCLVPLSCLSYITDGGASVVWPPSHFGGGAT